MRLTALPAALLLTATTAFQLPFFSALSLSLQDYLPSTLSNLTATSQPHQQQQLKRQYSNTCPSSFNSCANLGAAALCCAPNAVCSADFAGHVACCPSGAACSGTISGIITAGTVNSEGGLVVAAGATGSTSSGLVAAGATTTMTTPFQAASTTAGNGLVPASTQSGLVTTSGGGFVIAGSSTVATPGAGVRAARIPLVARAVIRVLEYLPL